MGPHQQGSKLLTLLEQLALESTCSITKCTLKCTPPPKLFISGCPKPLNLRWESSV